MNDAGGGGQEEEERPEAATDAIAPSQLVRPPGNAREQPFEVFGQADMLALEREHLAGLRAQDIEASRLNPLGEPVGLAFSGGGIRSATFNLGVLQAFAECRLLRRVDYLSTVSGGGYIGSWLSAVLHHQKKKLRSPSDDVVLAVEELISPRNIRKKDEEPAEVAFLRAYSNYLTPRLGAFSADTLAALVGYVRNMALTLFLAVLSIGLVLAVLHLVAATVTWGVDVAQNGVARTTATVVVGVFAFISAILSSMLLTLQSLDVRAHLQGTSRPGTLVQAMHFVQEYFGKGLLLAVLPSLALGGLLFEAGLPRTIDLLDVVAVGVAALLSFGLGSFFAYLMLELALWLESQPNASVDVDALRPAFILSVAAKAVRRAWRDGAHEWLRYLVAAPATAAVAFLLLQAAGRLDRVDPLVLLFRGPAMAAAVACVSFVVWLGVVGTTYAEPTREWLSRLFGTIVGCVMAWLAVGAVAINAVPAWAWLQALWLAGTSTLDLPAGHWWLLYGLLALVALWLRPRRRATDPSTSQEGLRTLWVSVACALVTLLMLSTSTIAFQTLLLKVSCSQVPDAPSALSYGSMLSAHLGALGQTLRPCQNPLSSFDCTADVQAFIAWLGSLWHAVPVLSLAAATVAISWPAFRYIDVNAFSLQNLYRNRLVRCYLGAAHHADRAPSPYAGFDPEDDLPLSSLKQQRPLHIVNSALNITQGGDLAWQQRKAASFSFTPFTSGYWLDSTALSGLLEDDRTRGGYVRTNSFACEPSGGRTSYQGVMLGTAMATSGAAVSSQMGSASRGLFAFVLTLANVRLGRWFPNPRPAAGKRLAQHSPPFAALWYLRELLGYTNERSHWVYLSDGGHFENLAIYELVRRRCRFIVAVDAGADPGMTFSDLGNAVRKCRVDFGVNIRINLDSLMPGAGGRRPTMASTLGKIDYPPTATSEGFAGDILYIKSCLPTDGTDLPADVLSYATDHPSFPHQPTTDQWFTESQFESYRQLGYSISMTALKKSQQVLKGMEQPNAETTRRVLGRSTRTPASGVPVPAAAQNPGDALGDAPGDDG